MIPAIRISLTNKCNLRCEYCPPYGENLTCFKKQASLEKFLQILDICNEIGFKSYRITGGEPLLSNLFKPVAIKIKSFKPEDFRLNTNGTLLEKNIGQINKMKFTDIKISLDTLNKKKYDKITGTKNNFPAIIGGIKKASKMLKSRIGINMVVTKKNFEEIPNMIKFCQKNKINLKLLDLNYFESPGRKYWLENYQSLKGLVKNLQKRYKSRTVKTVGNFGIPMYEFKINRRILKVKSSDNGTTYSKICKNCKYFPQNGLKLKCQEGIYNLLLTADAKLAICKQRPDLGIDLSGMNKSEIKDSFRKILEYYNNSFFKK